MNFQEFSTSFDEDSFNSLTEALNTGLKRLDFTNNMSGQIAENITIGAGLEVEIPHSLKVTPKYRIILKQQGNGVITDGSENWTSRFIYLKNEGAVDVIISVFLARG